MRCGTTQPTLTLTYPDTNVVTKTFNSRGLLSTITRGATTMLTRTYTNAGRLSGNTYGNGATETVTYDTEGLPASIAAPWGTASYTYDANDNRTAESITGLLSAASWNTGSTGFDFDDRLVTRNQTGNNESWTLSQVGNWNTYTLNGTGTNRTHGAAHEVATVGANSVTHDSRGNITQSETGKKYAWDFDGHMSSNDGDGNNTADVTYAYDALGRRVSRTAGGLTLVFCSLKHDTIGEYASGSAPGSPQRTYIHGQRIDEPIAMLAGSSTYYYHADATTSIRALTTTAGALTETYKYTSYGQPTLLAANGTTILTSSAFNNRYLFTAREWDDALTTTAAQQTGAYYFRARWLSPTLGRFVSRDPLSYVDGPGLYRAYFVPRSVDPMGTGPLDGCIVGAIGGAAGGATVGFADVDVTSGSFWDRVYNAGNFCRKVTCGAIGSCVEGAILTSFPSVLGGCIAGGAGSLVGSLCEKTTDIGKCELASALISLVMGCTAGWAAGGSLQDKIDKLSMALGFNIAAWSSFCRNSAPPRTRKVCCDLGGLVGPLSGRVTLDCPIGGNAATCCANYAQGLFWVYEVRGTAEGRCSW